MIRRHSFSSLFLLPLVYASLTAADLPYNPTRILLPQQPISNYAYLIQPGSDSSNSATFSSIDLSKSIDASSPSLNTLSSSLPFLEPDGSTAYSAFLDPSGNITVLSGDCQKGADGSHLWRFHPGSSAQNGNGTWTEDTLSAQAVGSTGSMTGSNYLSAGIAYSEIVGGNLSTLSLYSFGGMCPTSGATAATWQSSANYSNLILTMAPEAAASPNVDYQLSLISSKGPPIAEAGFTITPLSPTYSNASGIQTQQQDFVLVGGHTNTAFINMSQVALFSLPQESWTFLSVDQPETTTVQPRSGHTAVLSEDGKTVVVFGGWVGDVNTPATPQLAVLELGSGYGGSGDWAWTVPSVTGSTGLSGTGIYGHGAAMLPGGVMMVMGGYTISGSASRIKRSSQSSQTLFYNTSSSSWLSSYSVPSGSFSESASTPEEKSHLATSSQKAGLGVGLTVGVLLLIGLAVFYFWYIRRLKQRRRNRESDVQGLVSEKRSFENAWLPKSSLDGKEGEIPIGHAPGGTSPSKEAFPWLPELGASAWTRQPVQGGRDVERTGVFVDIPSPTRGLRRASGARNYQYQAAPSSEVGQTNRASGGIHPIEEMDEEERQSMLSGTSRPGTATSRLTTADAERRLKAVREIFDPQMKLKAVERALNDPFADPEPNPLGSHPVSPDPEYTPRRIPTDAGRISPSRFGHDSVTLDKDQISTWVNKWSAPPGTNHENRLSGRISPTKYSDDRTNSSLSDQSHRSYDSARSVARTTSTRSQAFFGASGTPYITPQASPTEERTFSLASGRRSPFHPLAKTRSVTAPQSRPVSDRDTFGLANLTFAQLQTEGEALLGASADPYTRANQARQVRRPPSSVYSQGADTIMGAEIYSAMSERRPRRGWMGSIRKALGTSERSVSAAIAEMPVDPASLHDRSTNSSPTKSYRTRPGPPHRTASESSTFLRTKRGKEDWITNNEKGAWEPYRDEPDGGDWGDAPGSPPSPKRRRDEDWDVEKVAEGRDVQIMFTVPKSRLRVVNADVDRASLRSVSGSGKSRKETAKEKLDKEADKKLVDLDEVDGYKEKDV